MRYLAALAVLCLSGCRPNSGKGGKYGACSNLGEIYIDSEKAVVYECRGAYPLHIVSETIYPPLTRKPR